MTVTHYTKFYLFNAVNEFLKFIASQIIVEKNANCNIHGGSLLLNMINFNIKQKFANYFNENNLDEYIEALYSVDVDLLCGQKNDMIYIYKSILQKLTNNDDAIINSQISFINYLIEQHLKINIASYRFDVVHQTNKLCTIAIIYTDTGNNEYCLNIFDIFNMSKLEINRSHSNLQIILNDLIDFDYLYKFREKKNIKRAQRWLLFYNAFYTNNLNYYIGNEETIKHIQMQKHIIIKKIEEIQDSFYYYDNNTVNIYNNNLEASISYTIPPVVSIPENLNDAANQFLNTFVGELHRYVWKSPVYTLIREFTDTGYISMNSYMFSSIYSNKLEDINIGDSEYKNNALLKWFMFEYRNNNYIMNLIPDNRSIHIYRGENNVNIGINGGFNNLCIGDTMCTPTHISTSLDRPFCKDILLRIQINKNSIFFPVLGISKYHEENEIILPYGSVLRVTNISFAKYHDNIYKLIDLIYVKCIYNTQDNKELYNFVKYYKEKYLQKSFCPLVDVELNMKNYSNLDYKIYSSINFNVPIKNIDEIDIMNPYNNISQDFVTYAKLPRTDNSQAYVGEYINHDDALHRFCIEDDISRLNPNQDSLGILTFNVHNFFTICKNKGIGKNIKKFIEYIDKLHKSLNIHIIGFQEIVPDYGTNNEQPGGNFKIFVEGMEQLGFKYYSIVNCNHNLLYNDIYETYYFLGNAIFSKIPFNEKPISYGLIGNRAVQVVNIMFNNMPLNIINTHLEFDDYLKLDRYKNPIIKIQIDSLYSIVTSYPSCILMGDFNHDFLTDLKFDKLLNLFEIPKYSFYNNNITGINSMKHIDHILMSKNIANIFKINSEIIRTNISDHYPVFSSFEPVIPFGNPIFSNNKLSLIKNLPPIRKSPLRKSPLRKSPPEHSILHLIFGKNPTNDNMWSTGYSLSMTNTTEGMYKLSILKLRNPSAKIIQQYIFHEPNIYEENKNIYPQCIAINPNDYFYIDFMAKEINIIIHEVHIYFNDAYKDLCHNLYAKLMSPYKIQPNENRGLTDTTFKHKYLKYKKKYSDLKNK